MDSSGTNLRLSRPINAALGVVPELRPAFTDKKKVPRSILLQYGTALLLVAAGLALSVGMQHLFAFPYPFFVSFFRRSDGAVDQPVDQRSHAGRLWATSEVGKGAIFQFTLPVEDPYAAVDAILKIAARGKIGDGKIFVYKVEEAIRIRSQERGAAAI